MCSISFDPWKKECDTWDISQCLRHWEWCCYKNKVNNINNFIVKCDRKLQVTNKQGSVKIDFLFAVIPNTDSG